jgi:hypothetical protein
MNNIKYELVNPERSIQLVKELQLSLDQKDGFFFDSNCSKEELRELKLNIQYIDSQLHNGHIDKTYLFKRWYRAFDMDILLYNEALCVLLGIPIDLAKAFIHADLSKEGIESELNECCTEYEFYNTNENDYLKRKYSHDSIDTKEFIEWAIDTNFIVKIIMPSIGVQHRSTTIELQKIINSIARDVMNKYPKSNQTNVALDVTNILKEKHDIDIALDTIRTKKLKKHPNY